MTEPYAGVLTAEQWSSAFSACFLQARDWYELAVHAAQCKRPQVARERAGTARGFHSTAEAIAPHVMDMDATGISLHLLASWEYRVRTMTSGEG